jgi:hypothetical protein
VFATRESTFPAAEIAAVREHTRAPLIMVVIGEAGTMLEQALDADVSDVLLLPQLTRTSSSRSARRRTPAASGRPPGAQRPRS